MFLKTKQSEKRREVFEKTGLTARSSKAMASCLPYRNSRRARQLVAISSIGQIKSSLPLEFEEHFRAAQIVAYAC